MQKRRWRGQNTTMWRKLLADRSYAPIYFSEAWGKNDFEPITYNVWHFHEERNIYESWQRIVEYLSNGMMFKQLYNICIAKVID